MLLASRKRLLYIAGFALAVLASASTWLYMNRILRAHQIADAAAHDRPRGNLSDLYPRWLGARELLQHGRNPYSAEITREIQQGYYGRPLDATRADDPKDQQGFAYPVYVVFLLAPAVDLPFEAVEQGFRWLLVALAGASVLLWLYALRWKSPVGTTVIFIILMLGWLPIVQGIKLQQISLLVAGLLAGCGACLAAGWLLPAGGLLALATIKPQLTWPLVLWLLLWAGSEWRSRRRFVVGFGFVMLLLLGGAELVLPGWLRMFAEAIGQYHRYTQNQSVLVWLFGSVAGRILEAVSVLLCAVCVWRVRGEPAGSAAFGRAFALVLALTVVIVPMFAPYNQVLLAPAILALLHSENTGERVLPAVRLARAVGGVLLLWPWVATLGLSLAYIWLPQQIRGSAQQRWTLSVSDPMQYTTTFAYDGPQPLLVGPWKGVIYNFWREDTTHAGNRGTINLKTSTDGVNWTLFSATNYCQAGDPAGCLFGPSTNNAENPHGGISFDGSTLIICFNQASVPDRVSLGTYCSYSTDGVNYASYFALTSANPTKNDWQAGYTAPMIAIPAGTTSTICPKGCDILVEQDSVPNYYLLFTFDHGHSYTLSRQISGAVTDEEAFVSLGDDTLMGFGRNTQGTTAPNSAHNLLFFETTNMGETWAIAGSPTNLGATLGDAPTGIFSAGAHCGSRITAWAEVSPFLVNPTPALPDGSMTLLFAERMNYSSSTVCNHMKLRAVNFLPANAIANPTGFNYGQVLYAPITPIPNSFVNFGYPTVAQIFPRNLLIEYYNESSFAGAVQLYTVTGHYGSAGSYSASWIRDRLWPMPFYSNFMIPIFVFGLALLNTWCSNLPALPDRAAAE